jgi:hypothetical protein
MAVTDGQEYTGWMQQGYFVWLLKKEHMVLYITGLKMNIFK